MDVRRRDWPGYLKDNVRGELKRLSRAKLSMTTPRYDPRTQPLVSSSLSAVGEPERNYIARVLSEAFAADRISIEELDDQLALLYQATTQQLGGARRGRGDHGRLPAPHRMGAS